MGVFLCIGASIHTQIIEDALPLEGIRSYEMIHEIMKTDKKVFICLGKGQHKIKRKAEQIACQLILENKWI
jgi:hypothetical protein